MRFAIGSIFFWIGFVLWMIFPLWLAAIPMNMVSSPYAWWQDLLGGLVGMVIHATLASLFYGLSLPILRGIKDTP
ncbi:hypothetical protein [Bremerella sp. P1]|uniref:hypothetical protein n=1 Tax=Bremerella sp. P1 TaxID=3026424 RepID=UPI0023687B3C|nr:hypothetical protein [Bremerella sp. P1]WDI44798.1 hypothetical protein PSR63_12715 [Bremerella sp. P1]